MRKFKENYAAKLSVKCRQTPRIMSSNYLDMTSAYIPPPWGSLGGG